jgi:WD40 repeat protein
VRSKPLESTITGLSWRSRGRQLVTSCFGGVQVFDSATLAISRRFRWKGSILTLALSPDERIVAAGFQDDTVHFWRFADGQDAQMSGYPGKPTSLSWSADSRSLATNGGPTIPVWPFDRRGPEGRPPRQLAAHRAPVSRVAFAPVGMRLATGCQSGELFLWDVGAAESPIAAAQMDAGIEIIAWSGREGRSLAVADSSGAIRLWSV